MKKIVVFLLGIIVLLTFSGCSCKHEWQDATCMSPLTCALCGETEGEPLEHEWVDATCDLPRMCSLCQATEGEPLGHNWASATYERPKTCNVCKATEGDKLKRKEATRWGGAVEAIKECIKFVPNCKLSIVKHQDNSYLLLNDGAIVGIVGIELDDFDIISLTDPDKKNAKHYHEQISIAIILATDSDLTYEEAKAIFVDIADEGSGWIDEYVTFASEGKYDGMYAFGVTLR